MHNSEVLIDVLIFLVAALVVVPLLRKLRSSPVIGYLAAGILIGPHGFGFIKDTDGAQTLAEFGVIFLLFTIGLELSFGRLRQLKTQVFGLGLSQVAVTSIVIFGIALALGTNVDQALVIGTGLALSSTAFVLQLLNERGERTTPHGNTSFAILLFQDLAIVPLLILIPLLGAEGTSLYAALGIAGLKAILALVVVIIAGRLVIRPAYRIIAGAGSSELFVAATLFVVLATSWALSLAGLSMALGAFLAGLLLAETEYRHQVEADIRPFRGILLGLFFMTIGMAIDFSVVRDELITVAAIVTGLLIGKTIITTMLCRIFGHSLIVSGRAGVMLSQGGEFAFVIFGVAMATGILNADIVAVLFAAVTISMAMTPLMALLGDKFAAYVMRGSMPRPSDMTKAAEDLNNHVIIVGFGRVGQTISMILTSQDIPHLALDLDHRLVNLCQHRGTSVYYGNAAEVSVLAAAGAGRARAVIVTVDQRNAVSRAVKGLRDAFPDLEVYVRARDLEHARQLEDLGATAVVPDTIEASLQLGGIVIRSLGAGADDVVELLDDFREDDYAKLSEIVSADSGTGDAG